MTDIIGPKLCATINNYNFSSHSFLPLVFSTITVLSIDRTFLVLMSLQADWCKGDSHWSKNHTRVERRWPKSVFPKNISLRK